MVQKGVLSKNTLFLNKKHPQIYENWSIFPVDYSNFNGSFLKKSCEYSDSITLNTFNISLKNTRVFELPTTNNKHPSHLYDI